MIHKIKNKKTHWADSSPIFDKWQIIFLTITNISYLQPFTQDMSTQDDIIYNEKYLTKHHKRSHKVGGHIVLFNCYETMKKVKYWWLNVSFVVWGQI